MSENSYLITLLQKENQTIIAYEVDEQGNYTGVEHTKSFFAKANSRWKFTVIPDKFHEDYWIHIIQSDHQTITVKDNAKYHDYRAGILVSYPDDDKLTSIQAGDLESSIYPETNYDVGVEDPHDRYKYLVVNQNCRIFATLARDLYNDTDYHTVIIKQTNHQTIIFTYRNKKYYGDTIVENNEDYTVEVIPDDGYVSTSLIINGKTINNLKTNGKVTTDLTITAIEAYVDSNYLEFTFKEFNSNIDRLNNSDGKITIGRLHNENANNSTRLNCIYQYKQNKIRNTPLLFHNGNNLYVSTLFDKNNLIYKGSTNNPKITSNNYIQPEILKYYGFDYLYGYFEELQDSSVTNKTISIKNSNNQLTLRILGFNIFKLSNKSNKKSARWIIGFNDNNNITINSISLYILNSNNSNEVIGNIINFKYLNTINGNTNDTNKVKLYYSNSINDELDISYLYLLSNKDKKVKVRLVIT